MTTVPAAAAGQDRPSGDARGGDAKKAALVDMDAHNGLRGVAALWVVVYHCLLYSLVNVNLLGSTLMPLFFSLSGFSLAVVYGRSALPPPSSCCGPRAIEEGHGATGGQASGNKPFSFWDFQQNRFARVMPGYYAGLFITLPQWFFGYAFFAPSQTVPLVISLVTSLLGVISLFAPVVGLYAYPIDPPTWTISTFLVMWLFFPRWLAHAQRLSDAQLVSGIVIMYYVQHALVYVLFFPIMLLSGQYWPAFACSTMHPFSRLSVFLMGVYAGVLCLRHPTGPLPWASSVLGLPYLCCGRPAPQVDDDRWPAKATGSSAGLLASTLLIIGVQLAIQFVVGAVDIGGNYWLQAWVAYEQLTVAVALTRDRGLASAATRFLRRPAMQWLGQVSMAVYVIHWPIMGYLAWAVRGGTNHWPAQLDCSQYESGSAAYDACTEALFKWQIGQLLPVWGVLVVLPLAVLCGWFLFRYVEEPGRKLLRAKGG